MPTDLFQQQTAAMQRIFADVTGADPGAFANDGVHITTRPEPPAWPFTAMAVTFGLGAVVCVEAHYRSWLDDNVSDDVRRAMYVAFPLAAEAARRGEELHPFPPGLFLALSERRAVPSPHAGYRLERVDKAWMDEWQPKDIFTNALGLAVQAHRRFRNRFAHVVFHQRDEPAAVAGAYDTAALAEIGVDAAPDHRGRGLSAIVTTGAANELLDAGDTPFYQCEVRNTRSQHTALASGFAPAGSLSIVMQAGMGLA